MKTIQEVYLMNRSAFGHFLRVDEKSKDIVGWFWEDIKQDGTLLRVVLERKDRPREN